VTGMTYVDMLQLHLPQLEDHHPNVVFRKRVHPIIRLVFIENFLACFFFLCPGLDVVDQFRGLRAHPTLRRFISSCGDI
jgi:hypothetical protein